MDWKIFIFLAVGTCYGQHTWETNPIDNNCYCVLDPTKDTDNWFLARSYCRDEVNGTLVDINAADTNTFVQNLLGSASISRAWLGVNGLNGVLSLISETPNTLLSYGPTWLTPPDALQQCTTMISNDGNWNSLECQGSGNMQTTACRVPHLDQSGNSIDTGCPLNAHLYGGKCYQAFSLTTSDLTLDGLEGHSKAMAICNDMTPAGKLILPTSDNENEFIRLLAKLTEFDKFWVKVEYQPTGNTFSEYGTNVILTYQNWDVTNLGSFPTLSSVSKGIYRFVMNVTTGDWEYDLPNAANGVMCVFDAATPTAAVQSPLCPPAPNQASTPTVESTPVPTSTPAVETTPAPTSTPAVETTPTPTSKPDVETTPALTSTPAVETTPLPTSTPAVEYTSAPTSSLAAETTSAPQPTSVSGTTPARIQLQSDESTVASPKGF